MDEMTTSEAKPRILRLRLHEIEAGDRYAEVIDGGYSLRYVFLTKPEQKEDGSWSADIQRQYGVGKQIWHNAGARSAIFTIERSS